MPISSNLGYSAIAKPGVCTSSTRPAAPFQGQVIYETDTGRTLVWNSTAWVFLSTGSAGDLGLVKVIPTTVSGTGVSLSANGVVTYSASTTVSVNGCFNASFARYRVIGMHTPSGNLAAFNMKVRAGGSDQNGTNYQYTSARLYTNVAIDATGSGNNNVQLSNGGISGFPYCFTFDIFDPASNTPTLWTYDASNFEGASAGVRWWSTGGYKANYAADGFTIYPASGNWTGSLTVYGYKD